VIKHASRWIVGAGQALEHAPAEMRSVQATCAVVRYFPRPPRQFTAMRFRRSSISTSMLAEIEPPRGYGRD
jgi:hypothetical protein